MLNVESWLKVTSKNPRTKLLKLKATSGPLVKELNHLIQIETRFVAVDKRLTDSKYIVRDHDLIGGFGVLTSPSLSHMLHLCTIHVQEWLKMSNISSVAAHHSN